MTDQKRQARHLRQVKLANQMPINRAALKLLPPEWANEGFLYSLSLIDWLITEVGVEDNFRPGLDSVEAMLVKLERGNPMQAMEYLTTNDSGDRVTLKLDGMDAKEAAVKLLQMLVDKMIATAP